MNVRGGNNGRRRLIQEARPLIYSRSISSRRREREPERERRTTIARKPRQTGRAGPVGRRE